MGALLKYACAAGDLLLAPFMALPPLAGLALLSAALGVVALLAFRWLTPQARLARVKELMSSTIYELRLFSASPVLVLAAQGRALWHTLRYMALILPSMMVLLPLVVLLLFRASLFYEVRPLQLGEVAQVRLELADSARRPRVISASEGLQVVPPVVLVRGTNEAYLRVRAVKPGAHGLQITVGAQAQRKIVHVAAGQAHQAVSPWRARAGSWNTLLSHEPPLPAAGALAAVYVDYPARDPLWPGLPWWLQLLVISMAAAFALRDRLGVVF